MEELLPDLFRIQIPLPNSPLKFLNSYVIRSSERNLIIDTGLNRKECLDAMQSGLQELGVDLAKTDFFITHLHADHFGLVPKLLGHNSKTFFNRPEAELIESWEGWEPMIAYGGRNGFPEHELRSALEAHPGFKFGASRVPEMTPVQDGDIISVGSYCFKCVSTPGHSLGHTCLYEAQKKILVAGDHILIDITPNIQCWTDAGNPLKDYLESLEKVDKLEIDRVFPGHRRLLANPRARIAELKMHHENRLAEILSILRKRNFTAYETASQMTWDIDCRTWDEFPMAQKWFATGEAIAHLRYLEKQGDIFRQPENGKILFSLRHTD